MNSVSGPPIVFSLVTTIDIVITGVVIGTGSAPVHSLIGILQNTKGAIDQLRALAQGRPIAAIRESCPPPASRVPLASGAQLRQRRWRMGRAE